MKFKHHILAPPLIAAGLLTLSANKAGNDSNFEGVVTYTITVEGNEQAQAMMQDATTTVFIKGDKTKSVTHTAMMNAVEIVDKKTPDAPVTLLEMMGYKYQIKLDDETKKMAGDMKPEITYSNETKTVAGYNCHKAVATITDKKGEHYVSNIYYTTELPYDEKSGKIKGLKGFPLEFNMKQQGMMLTMTAVSVVKKSVPDSTFNIPSGYQLMTPMEMQKDLSAKIGGH